jgi:hypothetical protein
VSKKKDPRSSFLNVDDDELGRVDLHHVGAWKRVPSTREMLIDTLAAATNAKHAIAIVEALEAYLAEPADRVAGLIVLPPDPSQELRVLRRERDEAVARAEKAEQELAKRDEEGS